MLRINVEMTNLPIKDTSDIAILTSNLAGK